MKKELINFALLQVWWLVLFDIGLPFTKWVLAVGIGLSIGDLAARIVTEKEGYNESRKK